MKQFWQLRSISGSENLRTTSETSNWIGIKALNRLHNTNSQTYILKDFPRTLRCLYEGFVVVEGKVLCLFQNLAPFFCQTIWLTTCNTKSQVTIPFAISAKEPVIQQRTPRWKGFLIPFSCWEAKRTTATILTKFVNAKGTQLCEIQSEFWILSPGIWKTRALIGMEAVQYALYVLSHLGSAVGAMVPGCLCSGGGGVRSAHWFWVRFGGTTTTTLKSRHDFTNNEGHDLTKGACDVHWAALLGWSSTVW